MVSTSAKAIVTQAANSHGIDPAVLWGVLGTETNYGADDKTSSAGAQGYFQLEPATARSLGVKNPNNFAEAANGAAKYMSEYKGRGVGGMLSAYNAGPAGGYQSGYVNTTLENAKSYGSGGNVASLPTVSRETNPSTVTIPGKRGKTVTTTSANPHAQGLSMLESLIESEKGGEGSENPIISTGVLSKAAAPTTTTKTTPATPARVARTATGVPVTAASAASPSIALPKAAISPTAAANAIHAPAKLPPAVSKAKDAMEAERHHPVSLPGLEHALTEAERGHGVVAEAPNGKVVATPKGPVYVPKKNPLQPVTP
jgi:soluble lytic murein transglycosylase-like protein